MVSDEELARRAQAGSFSAFESLVSRYEGRIFSFAVQACGNQTDAKEVTQDTFVKAFQALDRFDPNRVFGPWIFMIARRTSADCRRYRRRVANEPPPDLVEETDPSALLARQEEGEDLWLLARRHLSDLQYQALWLRYAEEMDVGQVSEALGKTRIHTKVILFRARQILGEQLRRRPSAAGRGKEIGRERGLAKARAGRSLGCSAT